MRLVAVLDQLADHGDAGGAQQLRELGEITVEEGAHDVGALLGPAGGGGAVGGGDGLAAVAGALRQIRSSS